MESIHLMHNQFYLALIILLFISCPDSTSQEHIVKLLTYVEKTVAAVLAIIVFFFLFGQIMVLLPRKLTYFINIFLDCFLPSL